MESPRWPKQEVSHFRRWHAWLLLLLLGLLLATGIPRARADGCYVPEKAFQKIPEITAQRALLKWKDGEETLLIASALDSESQKLGWIIPLPAPPSVIEKADPGGLKTLNFCVQPKIEDGIPLKVPALAILAFFVFLLVALWLFLPRLFGWAFLFLGLLLFAVTLFEFALGWRPRVTAFSPLPTEKTVATGGYDTAILQPKTFAELNAWLDRNGFHTLPADTAPAFADYLHRGWVFAATRLTRAEKGANTPAPLKVVFPTAEAVYPLRLSAVGQKAFPLELFVLGEKRAVVPALSTAFCDQYQRTETKNSRSNVYMAREPDVFTYFHATATKNGDYQKFGHPALLDLFWENCVLTKLSGTVSPARLGGDLKVQWMDYTPCRARLYTRKGALGDALDCFTTLFALFAIVSLLHCEERIRRRFGFFVYAGKWLLPGALGCALLAGAYFVALPKVQGTLLPFYSRDHWKFIIIQRGAFWNHFGNSYRETFATGIPYGVFPDGDRMSEEEIGRKICKMFRDPEGSFQHHLQWERSRGWAKLPNRLYGGNILCESTPGNFTVAKRDGKVLITVYDSIGLPTTAEYAASW